VHPPTFVAFHGPRGADAFFARAAIDQSDPAAVRVRGDAGGEDVTTILLDAAGEQEAPARLLTNPAEKF